MADRVHLGTGDRYRRNAQAGEGATLARLLNRDHARKYRTSDEPIHLAGVELGADARNLAAFETAPA